MKVIFDYTNKIIMHSIKCYLLALEKKMVNAKKVIFNYNQMKIL